MIRRCMQLAVLVAVGADGSRTAFAQGAGPVTVIRNATVLTVTQGTIENGTIVIRDGKIAAVGTNVAVPRGATEIDATGMFVMPGHHRRAQPHRHRRRRQRVESLGDVDGRRRGRPQPEGRRHLSRPGRRRHDRQRAARQRQRDRRQERRDQVALGQGRATACSFEGAPPGSSSRSARTPSARASGGNNADRRYPATRMGVEDVIREAFIEARAYQREVGRLRRGGQGRRSAAARPARDLQLEPLVEVLEGKRLVHAHCYRADEILHADPRRRGVRVQDRHASSTCSRATRSPTRSPRTAPAPRRSPTGGPTRSRPTTRSPTTPR